MSIDHIKTISLNPFYAAKILQCFLVGYGRAIDYKTLFYVLPIIMYKESRDKLSVANRNSRIDTIFGGKEVYNNDHNLKLSKKINLAGFVDRFNALNHLTKQAIIVLVNEEKIQVNNNIQLLKKESYSNYTNDIRQTLKAAYYLGNIFSKCQMDYLDDFLGVNLTCKAI